MEALRETRARKDEQFQQTYGGLYQGNDEGPAEAGHKDESVDVQQGDPWAEPVVPEGFDYRPSEPKPTPVVTAASFLNRGKDDDDEEVVESRYTRNSARLPRIGVDPGRASSTIADLRKQMTADE